ncbi:formyltransferase family protein [Sinorhizobium meliloti]|uniref:formyltransferase family protein n=2 Tax=Rhizobium meliloti TaxID=382 RepID=UPI0001E4CDEE|nr:formyltransferase family protein [Sinorhizobium meliloti]AEG58246.1 formyl transferase domain protein [Sinorhizobium meliloti AK83]SEJ60544.1 methionyl-tRNA formyltransferase [Sinorhizobium meliloti]
MMFAPPKRLAFAGTRGLASQCLRFIIQTCGADSISAILGAARESPSWWSSETPAELWDIAKEHRIPYVTSMDDLPCHSDYLVSVMWNRLFPSSVLARFKFGGINFHPAPLPQYRGSFARTHAILNGDKQFGVTVHLLTERADAGDILNEVFFPILDSETALSLDTRSQQYGLAAFCETWMRLLDGSLVARPQGEMIDRGERTPSFYPMSLMDQLLHSEDVPRSAEQADLLFRALYLPPRIIPPKWLVDRVLGNELRSLLIPNQSGPFENNVIRAEAMQRAKANNRARSGPSSKRPKLDDRSDRTS